MTDAQIFQLLGVVYFICGLGAFMNPKFYQQVLEGFASSPPLIYIKGFILLIAGFLLVSFHNTWLPNWPLLLVTIFGWVALIGGLYLLVFPTSYTRLTESSQKKYDKYFFSQALIVVILGLILMSVGFFVI